jgi:hypothetical protein
MDVDHLLSQMAANRARLKALMEGIPDRQARWKPDPESWSILEVVNNLCDEDREDFRTRLEFVLQGRPGSWPEIDPEGWATGRRHNDRNLHESVRGFLAARQESLQWLTGLKAPQWRATYATKRGPMTAGDLLASWVAHDLLHMRQLVELHWAWAMSGLAAFRVDYAGSW